MYLPAHFAEQRPLILQQLMADHPLATVVTLTADGLSANHLPLLFSPAADPREQGGRTVLGVLRGHVARANPFWTAALPGADVLVIFQGPQAYITPAWYPGKREHGRVVPTWNYAVVHARGILQIHDDAAWTHQLVSDLTNRHEANRDQPWAVTDAPAEYLARMMNAIVGIEVVVTQLTGKWKTSGNQPTSHRQGVAQGLAVGPTDSHRAMGLLVAQHDLPG